MHPKPAHVLSFLPTKSNVAVEHCAPNAGLALGWRFGHRAAHLHAQLRVLAQAVRDEILNIMHRNSIGEKRGTWMEDWHQKLHNNTTPDDVAICEAFIAFLRSAGDRGAYWGVLSDAGGRPSGRGMSMSCSLSVP